MTTVMISQPMYFPWVGFIAQMALADIMIWLDDVQFSKGSFTNRIQVKTAAGPKWMSIPLKDKGSKILIRDIEMIDDTTPKRHKDFLYNTFNKATYVAEMLQTFEDVWMPKGLLVNNLIDSAEGLADAIGLSDRQTFRASELSVDGYGSQRVLNLVKAVSGDTYLTGHGAIRYLDHPSFNRSGIDVLYMDYAPKPWLQDHGVFTPYVSALDLIAHVPVDLRYDYLAPQTMAWQTFLEQN